MVARENPYAAPGARVADSKGGDEPSGRPVLVWIISILNFIGGVWGLIFLVLVLADIFPLPPELKAHYASLTLADHAMTVGMSVINIVGAILLFRLRALAAHVMAAGLVVSLLTMLYAAIFTTSFREIVMASSGIGVLLGTILSIAVVAYVYHLRAKGVLK